MIDPSAKESACWPPFARLANAAWVVVGGTAAASCAEVAVYVERFVAAGR